MFGNLVENRICYKGDGAGGGGNDGPQTNPGSRERGREDSIGSIGVVDRTNPAEMRQREQDYVSDRLNTTNEKFAETARSPAFREAQRLEQEAVEFERRLGGGYGGADPGPSTAAPIAATPTMTDRQMLADTAVGPTPSQDKSAVLRMLGEQLQNAQNQAVGNTDEPLMGPAPRNDMRSGFFADAYDKLYGGTAPGTALGTILGASPISGLFGGNTPDPADAAAFNVGQLERMGGVRDPETGLVSGAQAGRGTLSMNPFGGVVYSGMNDPTYTGPFQELVRGSIDTSTDNKDSVSLQPTDPVQPVDPGTTTPEQIDDLAVNYLQNPFYLYSGQNNLFQPYGYAGNTLVDLLQTRNMQMPGQAAPNLGLFGNPRDFS